MSICCAKWYQTEPSAFINARYILRRLSSAEAFLSPYWQQRDQFRSFAERFRKAIPPFDFLSFRDKPYHPALRR